MSILLFLYGVIIKPLELIFEIIYLAAYRIINNPGFSIVALSLAMNFLVLPLYIRADSMQMEQQQKEKEMQKWVSHIKKTFKGDERFMMLQAYYRQNNYKPTHALRGSISLLLEIPFFVAAYHFLSHLSIIKGVPFGPIFDLGAGDGLLHLAGLSINLLPILMTVINIVSSLIYSKGLPLRSKMQLIGVALIFLIFLYKSPSGLVFYWTLNNLFSLLKNIVMKMKNPRKVLLGIFSVFGLVVLIIGLFVVELSSRKLMFVICLALLLEVPIVVDTLSRLIKIKSKDELKNEQLSKFEENDNSTGYDSKIITSIFVLASVFLAILTGLLISSTLVAGSTGEFVDSIAVINPLKYVMHSMMYALGIFVVWMGVFYYLSKTGIRKVFAGAMTIISITAVIDYMFFGRSLGNISPRLVFDNEPSFGTRERLINLTVIIICAAIAVIFLKFKKQILISLLSAGAVVLIVMSIKNIADISKEYKVASSLSGQSTDEPAYRLSRNGKNVVVIMMDRMVGSYIPYQFEEKPELREMYDGFTYYPNSLSYATTTNMGTPGLYGGYEYIPEEMNRRADESLKDKHNEALKVMPVLFRENGYDVTVSDPSYANYEWIPDLSIYDDYPEMHCFNASGKLGGKDRQIMVDLLCRNTFCYSLFKISPVTLQSILYDHGNYYAIDPDGTGNVATGQFVDSMYEARGLSPEFVEPYKVLKNLGSLSEIDNDIDGSFIMMTNDATHNPCILQEPEYEPKYYVDNTEYETEHRYRYDDKGNEIELFDDVNMTHYQVDMACLLALGQWFDYLRENDIYDNTRIIIVSDHSFNISQRQDMIMNSDRDMNGRENYDLETFNCTLMVKDYNSTGFTVDEQFMTNADVPTLATQEVIDKPFNPFTGKEIESSKKNGIQNVTFVEDWDIDTNSGNTFKPGTWFSVHDDVREPDNWKALGYY